MLFSLELYDLKIMMSQFLFTLRLESTAVCLCIHLCYSIRYHRQLLSSHLIIGWTFFKRIIPFIPFMIRSSIALISFYFRLPECVCVSSNVIRALKAPANFTKDAKFTYSVVSVSSTP